MTVTGSSGNGGLKGRWTEGEEEGRVCCEAQQEGSVWGTTPSKDIFLPFLGQSSTPYLIFVKTFFQ